MNFRIQYMHVFVSLHYICCCTGKGGILLMCRGYFIPYFRRRNNHGKYSLLTFHPYVMSYHETRSFNIRVSIHPRGEFHFWIYGIIFSEIPCSPSPQTFNCSTARIPETVQSLHSSPRHYTWPTHASSACKIFSSSLILQVKHSSRYVILYRIPDRIVEGDILSWTTKTITSDRVIYFLRWLVVVSVVAAWS